MPVVAYAIAVKIGVSASGWAIPADAAFLERIAAAGFDGIELKVRATTDLTAYRNARERLRETALGVTVLGEASLNVALDLQLYQLIDICTLLDARMLCGPFGGECDAKSIKGLRSAAGYAQRFGITLGLSAPVEPGDATRGTMSSLVRTIDAIAAPNVGVVYNTYRAHIDETSISSAILVAGERIKHVQIAENDGAAPGGGQVRWNETFAALKATRYDGWYIIDAKGNIEANALIGLNFLQNHLSGTANV